MRGDWSVQVKIYVKTHHIHLNEGNWKKNQIYYVKIELLKNPTSVTYDMYELKMAIFNMTT